VYKWPLHARIARDAHEIAAMIDRVIEGLIARIFVAAQFEIPSIRSRNMASRRSSNCYPARVAAVRFHVTLLPFE
jgi:hypothetical protein